MKRIIILLVCLCLYTAPAFAECPSPVGGSFHFSDGTRLVFTKGWTSKEMILQVYDADGGFMFGVPCLWRAATCEAELDSVPVIYLRVENGIVEISESARYELEY